MRFLSRLVGQTRLRPRELLGPPDPVSNIRPIIIGNPNPPSGSKTHPYSLAEFEDTNEDCDLQWRLARKELNAFNHAFWWDNNTRFVHQKEQVLKRFQEGDNQTTRDKEVALSNFYSQWSIQERARQAAYTAEWNRRNRAVIRLSINRQFRLLKDMLMTAVTGHPH